MCTPATGQGGPVLALTPTVVEPLPVSSAPPPAGVEMSTLVELPPRSSRFPRESRRIRPLGRVRAEAP